MCSLFMLIITIDRGFFGTRISDLAYSTNSYVWSTNRPPTGTTGTMAKNLPIAAPKRKGSGPHPPTKLAGHLIQSRPS